MRRFSMFPSASRVMATALFFAIRRWPREYSREGWDNQVTQIAEYPQQEATLLSDQRDQPHGKDLVPSIAKEESIDGLSLPAGWATCRFGDLCSVSGGSTPSKAHAAFWRGSIPWVSPKDIKVDFIRDAIDHISQDALDQTNLALVPGGSLLIVVRGMLLAHSFPIAVTEAPVTINQQMKALTPREMGLAPYLALVCQGFKPEILAMVERSTHGTCKLESSKIFGWLFPLPPLAEQSRIVARVESLRSLCADLRERLTASQATQSHLAESLIASATT
jgi:type I restriction enzyme, S subunit